MADCPCLPRTTEYRELQRRKTRMYIEHRQQLSFDRVRCRGGPADRNEPLRACPFELRRVCFPGHTKHAVRQKKQDTRSPPLVRRGLQEGSMKGGAGEIARVKEGGGGGATRSGGEKEAGGAEPPPDESTSHLRVHEWGLNPVFWVRR